MENYRQLLQELMDAIDSGIPVDHIRNSPLAVRIDAALEQPEPSSEVGSEWVPCVKLPVVVHVREQRPGESHVSTREGITPIHPDDLIMRGVQGEEYPIGRELFNQTYRLTEGTK